MLLFSVCAGIWAHDLAQAESLSSWLLGHPPSERVWRHALESRGYRAIDSARDERAFRKVARTLPSLADEEGTVWLSRDWTWVAFYVRRDDRLDTILYHLGEDGAPPTWQPAGLGWAAFDPVLARADEAVKRQKPVAKARTAYVDPMELRY